MLENANIVKALVDKTIECSKDYTDCKKDDILDQIAEYIAETVNDILHDPICQDITFCAYADGGGLRFGKFIGKSGAASAQFFFSREGCHLRLFLTPIGYWWEDKLLTNGGLKCLIKHWPVLKKQMNDAIQAGIEAHNETLSRQLSHQLELHEAVKNFQV